MAGKSLVVSMEITVAQREHGCRFNDKHRITKGMRRLTVKKDRDELNYCLPCAQKFLAAGIARLLAVQTEITGQPAHQDTQPKSSNAELSGRAPR